MVGTIRKTEEGWKVEYVAHLIDEIPPRWKVGMLPLHPEDVRQINADAQVFDNIEARIAANPVIDFEMVNMGFGPDDNILTYAKLKQPKQ